MLQMHRAPFSTCKCEFELPRTQMQKLHQWSEFNDSPVLKCVDNGHPTARSSNPKPGPSITRQRSPLKQHGERGPRQHQLGRACMMPWRATDRRGRLLLAAVRPRDSLHGRSSPACLSATKNAGAYAAVGNQNRLLPTSSCHGNVCAGKHTHWNRYRFCSRHKHDTFVYLK